MTQVSKLLGTDVSLLIWKEQNKFNQIASIQCASNKASMGFTTDLYESDYNAAKSLKTFFVINLTKASKLLLGANLIHTRNGQPHGHHS